MALKRAENTGGGGGFVNLKQLVGDHGPALAIFHIVEFEPHEKGEHSIVTPVKAHLRVVDGPLAGEVWMDQTFKYAITSVLRGVANPAKGEQPEAPINDVGDDIVVHLVGKNLDKANGTVFGNVPTDDQMETIADSEWVIEVDGELVAVWPEPALAGAPAKGSTTTDSSDRKAARPWKKSA
jgi:hypothetical protein